MPPILEKLLARMDVNPGFAALEGGVREVCRLIDGDGQRHEIAAIILRDPVFTAKLLHIANSSSHLRGERNVSTIDQVLAILGLDAVKSAALSLDAPSAFVFKPLQLKHLHAELMVARFTSLLAAGIAHSNGVADSVQEAQICGLLQNLGRILSLYYIYEDIERCHDMLAERNLVEDEAVLQALGTSYEDMGRAIAHHWGLPQVIQNSMAPGNAKSPPQAASTAMAWQWLCAQFCRRVAEIVFRLPQSREQVEIAKCINHFQVALQLNERDVGALIKQCLRDTDANLAEAGMSCDVGQAQSLLRKASERAWDMLPSQDSLVKEGIGSLGRAPIDIIKHILRLVHNHCNFDCTLICLPTGSSGLVAIAGVGRNAGKLATKFRISGLKQGMFQDIAARKTDTWVADVGAPECVGLMPDWYQDAADARTFAMLPLMNGDKLLGMIYGDYSRQCAQPPVSLDGGDMLGWRNRLIEVLLADAADFEPPVYYPSLVLLHMGEPLVMDERHSHVRIGRGVHSDIVMRDIRTSRKHARIVRSQGQYILTDLSFNGSYILIDGEDEYRVQHDDFVLHGSGSICLGYPHGAKDAEIIEFYFEQ
jgi:HD-like signal output (HDOD) protein